MYTLNRWIFLLAPLFLLIAVETVFSQEEYAGPQKQQKQGPPGMGMSMQHQPGGPFNDEVYAATSNDGLKFDVLSGPFFKNASVPDVLELSKDSLAGEAGTLFLYFVDFSDVKGPGTETISVATSTDGINWSERKPIALLGKRNKGAPVDPSVVELPDGKIRLYFFGSEMTSGDPAHQEGDHKIYSAISTDGINFEVEEGIRFQAPRITDPEVLRVGDEWLMFLSGGRETLLARSDDCIIFRLDERFNLQIGGVPGAVEVPDGKVRIFACGNGIVSAVFDPKTNEPPTLDLGMRIEGRPGEIVADPAPIRRNDGRYYLIFKKNIQHKKHGYR